MKISIIGPHQGGKTTIFKILLNKDISGNIGVFKPSDSRMEQLSKIFSSKKITYPEFTFIDLGAISALGKKDISTLQDVDLFISVIGAFFSEDPKKDLEGIITDIIISDLELVQNRISRMQKETRKGDTGQERQVLEKCQTILSDGKCLYKNLDKEEVRFLSGLSFLSLKPMIAAINIPEKTEPEKEGKIKGLEEYCISMSLNFVRFFGKTELELLDMDSQERERFLIELGLDYNFKEAISRMIFKELELITFFTAGEKETRGWHLHSGLSAIEAAGKIHSDIKRGFIRAEVVNYEDFIKCGSMVKIKEKGLLKIEGKDYIIRDGDIINIRFSV